VKIQDVSRLSHFYFACTTEGILVARFASHSTLDSPWGIAFAPAGFGPFGGKVLVRNFGDGRINGESDGLLGLLNPAT
jgi:hypothetical protein